MNFCAKCGNKVSGDMLFCDICGTRLAVPTEHLYCAQCGNKLAEDMLFCDECGAKIPHQQNLPTPEPESMAQEAKASAELDSSGSESAASKPFDRKKKTILIAGIGAVAVVAGIVIALSGTDKDKDKSTDVAAMSDTSPVSSYQSSQNVVPTAQSELAQAGNWMPQYSFDKNFYELMEIAVASAQSSIDEIPSYIADPTVMEYLGLREDGIEQIKADAIGVCEAALDMLEETWTKETLEEEYLWWVDEDIPALSASIESLAYTIEDECKKVNSSWVTDIILNRLANTSYFTTYNIGSAQYLDTYTDEMYRMHASGALQILAIADAAFYPIFGEYLFNMVSEIIPSGNYAGIIFHRGQIVEAYPELYPEYNELTERVNVVYQKNSEAASQQLQALQEYNAPVDETTTPPMVDSSAPASTDQTSDAAASDPAGIPISHIVNDPECWIYYEKGPYFQHIDTGAICEIVDRGDGDFGLSMDGSMELNFYAYNYELNEAEQTNTVMLDDTSKLTYAASSDTIIIYDADHTGKNHSGTYARITEQEFLNKLEAKGIEQFEEYNNPSGWYCEPLNKWYRAYDSMDVHYLEPAFYCPDTETWCYIEEHDINNFSFVFEEQYFRFSYENADDQSEPGRLVYRSGNYTFSFEYSTQTLYITDNNPSDGVDYGGSYVTVSQQYFDTSEYAR